jgi:uncharacterized protein (DUF58 family)
MDNSINDDTAIDFASFRPLAWLGLLMVALWVIFYMTLPSWAGWTFAIILGLATSFILGDEIKAFQERRIKRKEREQRAEIQEGIDRAGHG